MSASLERLAERVRQAEAKARSDRLETETRSVADALRVLEVRTREAEMRLREQRPHWQRVLEEVEDDQQELEELIRKVAHLRGMGAISASEINSYEVDITDSRAELEARRREAESTLEQLNQQATSLRGELNASVEQYQSLRRELERLHPEAAAAFAEADLVARTAENLTPVGQLRALVREVEDGAPYFGELERPEQLAQLSIWIGRHRRLQALPPDQLPADSTPTLQRLFHRLVGLSKQHEPGYIEAFRQNYHTDWDMYIQNAEDRLREATESARQRREAELRRRGQPSSEHGGPREARADANSALPQLRALASEPGFSEDPDLLDDFYRLLDRVLTWVEPGDPALMRMLSPHVDLFTGGRYRAIRKQISRLHESRGHEPSDDSLRESIRDVIDQTRGLKAVMIGGIPSEDRRRRLERLFEFDELDWERHDDDRATALESIKQCVRNQSIDMVLIIESQIPRAVPEQLRPLSEQNDIPCLMLGQGSCEITIAETLRRALVK